MLLSSGLLPLFAGLSLAASPLPFGQVGPNNAVLFFNGFHFVNGEMSHQMQANHHCAIISEDFIQCIIYDSHFLPSKLRGIEYIISAAAFANLTSDEKQLWHSHSYEVTSGSLIEPGLPQPVDDAIMETLVTTYGKTFHTWRWDQRNNTLPLGIPELVMGFTADGQLCEAEAEARDHTFNISSQAVAAHRATIIKPVAPLDGADSWEQGYCVQLTLANGSCNH